ncbi:preprotein translocase subunit SecY [Treponema zioleckii]|uniref:preprotein translocase subunit SecY n=1 Tax=Treponema zioleckii TaxID=331680 RepID=UPI00168AB046|nr:preprotein translocase subunit SecY [Treponema zioleckii]
MANNPVVNIFRIKELRDRLFFTFVILVVFRLGCVLTIPGIDAAALVTYFEGLVNQNKNAFASYMDFFAGGAFSNFSVFMLGVMPYVSTQIILQLALIIFPGLKKAAQEDGGQRRVAAWTRIGTVFVCLIQSLAVTVYASSIPNAIAMTNPIAFRLLAMLTVTTGAMVTIWLGDQITAHGIGNGISMLIFAGIVARLPHAVMDLGKRIHSDQINIVLVIVVLLMFVAIIALVVFEQRGERKIPVHYAKRVVGRKMYGGGSTYIPFKINPSGVIPVIFASSFLTFPLQIVSTLGNHAEAPRWVSRLSVILTPTGLLYNVLLVLLIVFFAYFYTQVTLNPIEIAKNVRENGGSIPGIRTDKIEEYMQKVLNRLVLPGSLYLALIAVIPTVVQIFFDFPQSIAMLMGGTSLLILVGVDLDTMSQIEALLKMHHADGLVKKGKLRSRKL